MSAKRHSSAGDSELALEPFILSCSALFGSDPVLYVLISAENNDHFEYI